MSSKETILSRTLRLIKYYPRTIGLVVMWLLMLTLFISLFKAVVSPTYKAKCTVTTLPSVFELSYTQRREDVDAAAGPAMALSQTHTEFLLSRTMAREVVEKINGDYLESNGKDLLNKYVTSPSRSAFNNALNLLNYGRLAFKDTKEKAVSALQNSISVNNIPGSFILEITVDMPNSKRAALAANFLAEQYVEKTRQDNRNQMRVTRRYITDRIEETRQDLASLENKIKIFREENNYYLNDKDIALMLEELSAYRQTYNTSDATAHGLEAQLDTLSKYEPEYSLAEIKARLDGLQSKKYYYKGLIDEASERLDKVPAQQQKLAEMYRNQLKFEQALTTLHENLLQTQIAEARQLSSIRIIDPAYPPSLPYKPRVLFSCVAAIFVGMILSGGYIGLREHFNGFIRTPADLEEMGLSVFGVVPHIPSCSYQDQSSAPERSSSWVERLIYGCEHRLSNIMARDGSNSASMDRKKWNEKHKDIFDTHVDHIVEHLSASGSSERTTIFTSVDEGDGKSFVVRNLAARARAAGMRILVINANTRNPVLDTALPAALGQPVAGIRYMKGVYDIITADADIEQLILNLGEGIDLIPAGSGSLYKKRTWNAENLKKQVDRIAQNYDLVLIDCPSMRSDPIAKRLWQWNRMVCILDALRCKYDHVVDIKDKTADYSGQTLFVLNDVRHEKDYLYDG